MPSPYRAHPSHVARPYAIEAAAENQHGAVTYSNGFSGYAERHLLSTASAVYPSAAASTAVKNVAYPYASYPAYVYGFNTYPYGTYGAVPYPYVAAAPAAAPAKA
ncbi:hypothetical protein DAPPUDRAFT_262101 [Daphnia pulex]|uniref:Uncharacterized protein n=1 Tax=Daphnia pulex TaxID=6669 RepID=E9HMC9_DAPPU|nr:hypothetical protein DAPPUDRAFT_262101 [Daphnia pulex]|eukprot:EFX67123.1 hypothetical protein DAPPUDRAFT_262101 [Daphnia pulex]